MEDPTTISDLLQNYSFKERTTKLNKRQDLIKMFVDKINAQRVGTKYRPVTGRGIAMKLAHVKTNDLYQFYRSCEENTGKTGFSGAFYSKLKV